MKLSVKYSFPVIFVLMLMAVSNCSAQQYVYMPGIWKLKKITPKLDTSSSAKNNTPADTSVKSNTVAKGIDLAKIDSLVKNDTLAKIAYRTPGLKLALTDKVLAIKDPSEELYWNVITHTTRRWMLYMSYVAKKQLTIELCRSIRN